jgi:hypothetical protein
MAEATYERSLRPDISDVIVPELLSCPRQQLRQVFAPAHLFHFDSLVGAFASELIQRRSSCSPTSWRYSSHRHELR